MITEFLPTEMSLTELRNTPRSMLPALAERISRSLQSPGPIANQPSNTERETLNLLLAVHHVFDTAGDKILWDLDPDLSEFDDHVLTGLIEPNGRASNETEQSQECPVGDGDAFVPGSGLHSALAIARARQQMGESHWVVIVTAAESLQSESPSDLVDQLSDLPGRFLLIAVSDSSRNGADIRRGKHDRFDAAKDSFGIVQQCATAVDQFASVNGCDVEQVVLQLQRIKNAGQTSLLRLAPHRESRSFHIQNERQRLQTDRQSIYDPGPNAEFHADDDFVIPPEFLERERQCVEQTVLSPEVEGWYEIYAQAGIRSRFLWKWCVHGAELTTLPCVLPEWRRHLCDTKVLSIMLCVLLDDAADVKGDAQLLETLMSIVERRPVVGWEGRDREDQLYADVTERLAIEYERRVRRYPCYDVFAELLHFDLLQYFNTMRFSNLLNNQLHLLNSAEHDLYLPHAMHMMSFSTLDLMCTPDFPLNELGKLREMMWFTACMGRVGNLLSTWRREIDQHDFTSGLFARAVMNGDLTIDQLTAGPSQSIETAVLQGKHEQYYVRRWMEYRECLRTRAAQVSAIDWNTFVECQERFLFMHLGNRDRI